MLLAFGPGLEDDVEDAAALLLLLLLGLFVDVGVGAAVMEEILCRA